MVPPPGSSRSPWELRGGRAILLEGVASTLGRVCILRGDSEFSPSQVCWGIVLNLLERSEAPWTSYPWGGLVGSPRWTLLALLPRSQFSNLPAPLATWIQALECDPHHTNYPWACFLLPNLLDLEHPSTLKTKTMPLISVTPSTETTWGLPTFTTPSTEPCFPLFSAQARLHIASYWGWVSGHGSWPTHFTTGFSFFSQVGLDVLKSHPHLHPLASNYSPCLSILMNSSMQCLLNSSESTRMWRFNSNFAWTLLFFPSHHLLAKVGPVYLNSVYPAQFKAIFLNSSRECPWPS